MKILVDVKRETWSSVKQYATLRNLRLGRAVDKLLRISLSQSIQHEGKQNWEIGKV